MKIKLSSFAPVKENPPAHGTCAGRLLLLAALALCGCQKEAAAPLPPPTVEVAKITPTNTPSSIEFIGQLDSSQNVEVRARVEGFVDKMLFVEGTEIKEGAPLFRLDDKPFKERLAAAEGAFAEAKAALSKSQKDVARLTPLAEKRAVPQQDLDHAVAAQDGSEAAVLTAQARLDSAKIDLGYCDIRAPVSGLIGGKQISIGDLVGKGQPTLLVTISTLDPIWFYCNVSEVDFLRAQRESNRTGKKIEDLPVELLLADGSTLPEKGRFVFLDRAVDAKTGTLRARVQFPNPRKQLRPGMFARIQVDLGTHTNTLEVPQQAVTELQGKSFVWTVDAQNKVSQRPVELGDEAGENVVVKKGLNAGERIVVEGLQKIRDGTTVQPLTASELAAATQNLTPTGRTNSPKE
jgi:membrane fusion protein (multidrug efflux system)